MADAFTPNLGLTLMENGTHNNTWNDEYLNNDERIDAKIGDVTTINSTGGTQVLTGAQERVNVVKATGVLVSNLTIEFSGVGGAWVIQNDTTGAFTLTVKVTGQTGVTVTQGTKGLVYFNGTDIAALSSETAANLGLGTADSPQFAGVNVGDAADTTITRASAGMVAVEGVTIEPGANRCSFRAHKNGTSQTISSTSATKVTFGTESFDVGSKFASSRWTPVAGTALINFHVTVQGITANEPIDVYLYKNGSATFRAAASIGILGDIHTIELTIVEQTNGTDYYEVYVDSDADASYEVNGAAGTTWFSGAML
jgi:hypothetical protein